MDLRQLTTFRHLAATLSFTRTASALGYGQSSISAQIKALEEELGLRLFERLGRRVTLTDAGQRLLVEAERLLELAQGLPAAIAEPRGADAEVHGTVVMSAPESVCAYRLPPLLRAYRARHPSARLLFRAGPVADLRRRVREGELDAAFVLEPPIRDRALATESLAAEPVLVVAAPEHPLASSPAVRPTDLDGESLLLTEGGCGYRTQFEHALAMAGVQPVETLEFGGIEAIKQCAMVGMGIAALPAMAVSEEVRAGQLVALRWAGPPFRLALQMVWHRQKWRSPSLEALLALSREVLMPSEERIASVS
jgi:DNA-binding transcriptional LysR family regulator